MKYLTTLEAAAMLGVDVSTVVTACNDGRLQAIKTKRHGRVYRGGKDVWLIPADVVQAEVAKPRLDRAVGSFLPRAERRRVKATHPKAGDHRYMILVHDPSGDFPVGYGKFDRAEFCNDLLYEIWPDGSLWKGTGGDKPDQVYRVQGMMLSKVGGNGRLRFQGVRRTQAEAELSGDPQRRQIYR